VHYSAAEIELKDRACLPVSISYEPNGRIAGRIVDDNGLPARKVFVSVFPSGFTTKQEYPLVSMQTKLTDAEGRYEIGPLPPGDYQVGVNVEVEPSLQSPYARTYYPGVLVRAKAETISVDAGEVRRANFALPQKLPQITVSGRVLFPDGAPAPGVDVSLVAGSVGIASTRTDTTGAFTLTGLSGETYSVRAWFHASADNKGSAETSVSLRDEPVTGLELVLRMR
jgi:carboxypeptidase family protein